MWISWFVDYLNLLFVHLLFVHLLFTLNTVFAHKLKSIFQCSGSLWNICNKMHLKKTLISSHLRYHCVIHVHFTYTNTFLWKDVRPLISILFISIWFIPFRHSYYWIQHYFYSILFYGVVLLIKRHDISDERRFALWLLSFVFVYHLFTPILNIPIISINNFPFFFLLANKPFILWLFHHGKL